MLLRKILTNGCIECNISPVIEFVALVMRFLTKMMYFTRRKAQDVDFFHRKAPSDASPSPVVNLVKLCLFGVLVLGVLNMEMFRGYQGFFIVVLAGSATQLFPGVGKNSK